MRIIEARNVGEALAKGLSLLATDGIDRSSRNGPVRLINGPVCTVYEKPRERVVLWPRRDANPFFHLYEALWMLGGRQDVAPLAWHVGRMAGFSDDGVTLRAAYGYRWRHHFGPDQLEKVATELRLNPDSRRCYVQIWDQARDLQQPGKDVACNLGVHFSRDDEGRLDMVVPCRSNDIIWGAYGANAVHFSFLQEYVAARIGCPVGRYWQISFNFHAYKHVLDPLLEQTGWYGDALAHTAPVREDAAWQACSSAPLIALGLEATFQDSLRRYLAFVDAVVLGDVEPHHHKTFHRDSFFSRVAMPMACALNSHRQRDYARAVGWALKITDPAWRAAATEWLERRHHRRVTDEDGGEKNRTEA